MAEGRIVATREVEDAALDGFAIVLEHERIPFVSYPYEWAFSMLKAATLLQLELLRSALEEDLVLKDGTPYNIQFRGSRPVFIDVGSIERLRPGEPWAGYRQFCMLCLYPLLLQSLRDVPFQPWLRGSLEGIAPGECRNLLTLRDRLRRGVLTHVVLHARLEARYADRARDVRSELGRAGFGKEIVAANARKLARLVERLDWHGTSAAWGDYRQTSSYDAPAEERKATFVRACVAAERPALVWDLGCNDGAYSRLAAERAEYVVAVDGDAAVVDRLYRELATERNEKILPLVLDLADPSPGLGWRGLERKPPADRARPDLVLALALVHHLAITRNLPLGELVGWLRELGARLVIEFVDPDDPMARRLLAAKRAGLHGDYTREAFEHALGEAFSVQRREELPSGTRVLYLAHPRG